MEEDKYIVVTWPDIQELMDEEDFDENATLIEPNSYLGIDSCTYLVDKDWVESLNED